MASAISAPARLTNDSSASESRPTEPVSHQATPLSPMVAKAAAMESQAKRCSEGRFTAGIGTAASGVGTKRHCALRATGPIRCGLVTINVDLLQLEHSTAFRELPDRSDVGTAMIYTRVPNRVEKVSSALSTGSPEPALRQLPLAHSLRLAAGVMAAVIGGRS